MVPRKSSAGAYVASACSIVDSSTSCLLTTSLTGYVNKFAGVETGGSVPLPRASRLSGSNRVLPEEEWARIDPFNHVFCKRPSIFQRTDDRMEHEPFAAEIAEEMLTEQYPPAGKDYQENANTLQEVATDTASLAAAPMTTSSGPIPVVVPDQQNPSSTPLAPLTACTSHKPLGLDDQEEHVAFRPMMRTSVDQLLVQNGATNAGGTQGATAGDKLVLKRGSSKQDFKRSVKMFAPDQKRRKIHDRPRNANALVYKDLARAIVDLIVKPARTRKRPERVAWQAAAMLP